MPVYAFSLVLPTFDTRLLAKQSVRSHVCPYGSACVGVRRNNIFGNVSMSRQSIHTAQAKAQPKDDKNVLRINFPASNRWALAKRRETIFAAKLYVLISGGTAERASVSEKDTKNSSTAHVCRIVALIRVVLAFQSVIVVAVITVVVVVFVAFSRPCFDCSLTEPKTGEKKYRQ